MRIAYVCADLGVPVFGKKGSSIHIQEVIRAIMRQNVQVDLFASRFGGEIPDGFEKITIHKLPAPPKKGSILDKERAAIAANRDLKDMLAYNGPFDMVYERYSLWSFAGMDYAIDKGIPGLLEVNAPLIEEQTQYRSLIDRASAEWVAKRAFGAASKIVVVSKEIKTYLNNYSINPKHIHVIANAVDPDRFDKDITPICPASQGIFSIGFVGSLKPWHGLPFLVEAYSILHCKDSNIRLIIVGDGPERQNLTEYLTTLGLLETVHLTGAVDPNDIPGFLASMDVAVAPYPQQFNFYFSPLKIFEYMAAGLPVVASHVGQIAELIQDGFNGILCPPNDPIALANALDRLRCEPVLRAHLGKAARQTIIRDHTWEGVSRQILHLAGLKSKAWYNGD